MALPSPTTAGRLLMLLNSLSESAETSSSKREKKKSSYKVGSVVQAEVISVSGYLQHTVGHQLFELIWPLFFFFTCFDLFGTIFMNTNIYISFGLAKYSCIALVMCCHNPDYWNKASWTKIEIWNRLSWSSSYNRGKIYE